MSSRNNFIGGFLGLERTSSDKTSVYPDCKMTWCGRAAFKAILLCIAPKKIYLPDYYCISLLEPIKELGIETEFVPINDQLEWNTIPSPNECEYVVYINYFGVKTLFIDTLIKKIGGKLIIDNTQAFYHQPNRIPFFNSLRKFFGIPDGAFFFTGDDCPSQAPSLPSLATEEHLHQRRAGNQEEAYALFRINEKCFSSEYRAPSSFSLEMLPHIHFEEIRNQRRKNFLFLHQHLSKFNKLHLFLDPEDAPLAYPFLTERKVRSKQELALHGIFIPTYWPEMTKGEIEGIGEISASMASDLYALPLNQNLEEYHMQRLFDLIFI